MVGMENMRHSHATVDLVTNIQEGNFPKWDFFIQTMDPAKQEDYRFDPLDCTKVTPAPAAGTIQPIFLVLPVCLLWQRCRGRGLLTCTLTLPAAAVQLPEQQCTEAHRKVAQEGPSACCIAAAACPAVYHAGAAPDPDPAKSSGSPT